MLTLYMVKAHFILKAYIISYLNFKIVAFLGKVIVFSFDYKATNISIFPLAFISLYFLPWIKSKNNSIDFTTSSHFFYTKD